MAEISLLRKQLGTPSTTGATMAAETAYMRAFSANDPRQEYRGNDILAEVFIPDEQKITLKDIAFRTWVLQNKFSPGLYEYMIARTTFFDQLVLQALIGNIAQIVFLGAGYDSRAYRFEKQIQDTIIFELDTQPTLQRKRDCLRQAHVGVPPQVRHVAIDFLKDDLMEKLLGAGFNSDKKTLFIWEGLTYHLDPEIVDSILSSINSISPAGSYIGFDYTVTSPFTASDTGSKELKKHMVSIHANEPIRFGIRAGEINTFMDKRNFEVTEHLNAAEMTRKYLPAGGNAKYCMVLVEFGLVHARVKG